MTERDGIDRITRLRVQNARCIADVDLALGPLTVLVGPNGSGKSTLIEVLEILRLMGTSSFDQELTRAHGGLAWLKRHGEQSVRLRLQVEGHGDTIKYDVSLTVGAGGGFAVSSEALLLGPRRGFSEPLRVISREPPASDAKYFDQQAGALKPIPDLSPNRLALHSFGQFPPNAAISRLLAVLAGMHIHLPFEVRAGWASPGTVSALRSTNIVRPARKLERFGANLANVWHTLKNDFGEAHWQATMLDVRAGLGAEIDTVATEADPGGGQIALKLRYRDGTEHPAFTLSDGTLAYLAFVALRRLGDLPGNAASLLAFDEPELHLHPELLVRVVGFFEELSATQPIVLATHSDRVLDVLSDPAASVVLCELGPDRTTKLLRPDKQALDKWLDRYRGLGQVRAEGYEASVFTREEPSP